MKKLEDKDRSCEDGGWRGRRGMLTSMHSAKRNMTVMRTSLDMNASFIARRYCNYERKSEHNFEEIEGKLKGCFSLAEEIHFEEACLFGGEELG